jgi:hypothetical protein
MVCGCVGGRTPGKPLRLSGVSRALVQIQMQRGNEMGAPKWWLDEQRRRGARLKVVKGLIGPISAEFADPCLQPKGLVCSLCDARFCAMSSVIGPTGLVELSCPVVYLSSLGAICPSCAESCDRRLFEFIASVMARIGCPTLNALS